MRAAPAAVVTAALVLAAAVLEASVTGCGSSRSAGPPVTMSVPALHGGQIALRHHRGRPVVVHLFTTWSLTSQADVPQLTETARKWEDRVTVIGVALDPDGYELVAPWRADNEVPYLVGLATDALRRGDSPLGRIGEVPTTVVLDRSGRVARRIERPLRPGELDRVLRGLVAKR